MSDNTHDHAAPEPSPNADPLASLRPTPMDERLRVRFLINERIDGLRDRGIPRDIRDKFRDFANALIDFERERHESDNSEAGPEFARDLAVAASLSSLILTGTILARGGPIARKALEGAAQAITRAEMGHMILGRNSYDDIPLDD